MNWEEPFKEYMDELFWDGFTEEIYKNDFDRYQHEYFEFLSIYASFL